MTTTHGGSGRARPHHTAPRLVYVRPPPRLKAHGGGGRDDTWRWRTGTKDRGSEDCGCGGYHLSCCLQDKDAFICATWLIHMCDMTHTYAYKTKTTLTWQMVGTAASCHTYEWVMSHVAYKTKSFAYTTKSLHTGGGRGLVSGSGTRSSSDCCLVLLRRPFPRLADARCLLGTYIMYICVYVICMHIYTYIYIYIYMNFDWCFYRD